MTDGDLAPFCATCRATKAINWAPAFGVWLCAQCRCDRCERELNTPVTVLPLPRQEVR